MLNRLFENLAGLFGAPRPRQDKLPFTEVWTALDAAGFFDFPGQLKAFIAITPYWRQLVVRRFEDGRFEVLPDPGDPLYVKVDFSPLFRDGQPSWRYPVKLPWDNMGFYGALSGGRGKIVLKNAQQREVVTEAMS